MDFFVYLISKRASLSAYVTGTIKQDQDAVLQGADMFQSRRFVGTREITNGSDVVKEVLTLGVTITFTWQAIYFFNPNKNEPLIKKSSLFCKMRWKLREE